MFDINIKARIKRHSRIFKENILNKSNSKVHKGYGYNIVILTVLFIIPIYPAFAGYIYTNNEYDFYRGDIDESSIIDSYSINKSSDEDSLILESKDSFLSVSNLNTDGRDLSGTNEIVNYEVQEGDSIGSIANDFEVSSSSINWANGFSTNHIIHPGDKIKVPPVSGIIHYVKSGETIDSVAKEYSINKDKIISQNLLSNNENLVTGSILIVPGAIKNIIPNNITKDDIVIKRNILTKKSNNNKKLAKNKVKSSVNKVKSSVNKVKGNYKLVKRSPKWKFYWGNCTWYVAQYKNVDWSGNAKNWLANAKAKGHKTSTNPSVGSIIVFSGKGYNPVYGHVGIVTSISGNNLIISDMNYRRLGEVTSRKVSKDDGAIKGYIVVD